MHCALRVLVIVLQQRAHQLPVAPVPLGVTVRRGNTSITYYADHISKVVEWDNFANRDEQSLLEVYRVLRLLPNGVGLQHPRGLLRPLARAHLSHGRWRVQFPLATPHRPPANLQRLRLLVADVLHGLRALHEHNIVHRDVRFPNVLEVSPWDCLLGGSVHVSCRAVPCR